MTYSHGSGRDPFSRPSPPSTPAGHPRPRSEVHIWEEKPPAAGEAVQAHNPAQQMGSARSPSMTPSAGRAFQGGLGQPGVSQRYPWFIGGFFVIFFGYLLFLQSRSDVTTNGALRAISDIFVLIGSVVCAVVCIAIAIRLHHEMQSATPGIMARRGWIGWLCMGGSATAYSIGQIIWTTYDAGSSSFPFPASYDYFYLAVYPLGWVGVALLIPRSGSAAGRTRLLLDAAIVVASTLAVSWYFLLGPTIEGLSGSALEKTVALAYPLGDLSLCVAAALLIFGPSGVSALSGAIWRLGIGVTVLAVTDTLYSYFVLQGTYHTGFLQDVGWPMAWLFIGWGALVYPDALARLTGQRLPDEQVLHRARLSTASAAFRAVLPIVITLLTCVLLGLGVGLRDPATLTQVLLVCVGLFILPIVRQMLTLVDNLILNERLRVALGQSQRAFQRSQQELLQTSTRAQQYEELRAGIEDLQGVHAKLARGDFTARAHVEGPLSPVSQSLNLLIERLHRWAQYEQSNRVLEEEANWLRELLDGLSEGRLVSLPGTRSTLPTGAALVSAMRLQRYLALRFGRLRDGLDILGTRWKLAKDAVRQAQQLLRQGPSNEQTLTVLEALIQVEQRLESSQSVLQDFWLQTKAYEQGGLIEGVSLPLAQSPLPGDLAGKNE